MSALNTSGLLCSIYVNYSWFFTVFLVVLYVVSLFLFSYLQSIRLLVTSSAILFVASTILIGYGFIGPIVWMGTLVMLIFSVIIMYMSNKR